MSKDKLGQIIILNGAPRSGKSSIATAIQHTYQGMWMNLGVDRFMEMTPVRYQPGIGLRPGGERSELEPYIIMMYQAMYESIAAHSKQGINVVVDVGHHDQYSVSRNILPTCAKILRKFPVLFVGVHCPIDVIMQRRIDTWQASYLGDGSIPKPVKRWQESVHDPGIYDIEVDTSILSAEACASLIQRRLEIGPPATAFQKIAEMDTDIK